MELTGLFRVVSIKKKTKAEFFKDMNVGDEFELVYDLNGMYENAPRIKIYREGYYIHTNNAVQLKSNLDKFEILQI